MLGRGPLHTPEGDWSIPKVGKLAKRVSLTVKIEIILHDFGLFYFVDSGLEVGSIGRATGARRRGREGM